MPGLQTLGCNLLTVVANTPLRAQRNGVLATGKFRDRTGDLSATEPWRQDSKDLRRRPPLGHVGFVAVGWPLSSLNDVAQPY